MELQIKKLNPGAKLPQFAHDTDAGMDFFALNDVEIKPGERCLIDTGIAMALPSGCVALIWDKSSVPTKKGVTTLAGVLDEGYRGEVKILVLNISNEIQTFAAGDKVAQVLIQKVEHPQIIEVAELDETTRGEGGFGSTGS
ncbi:MAG TPA: dUTP diphosphatase [Candidatus Paceibacterota bacterium]|nr:dUTP diphosphatase [Candidatus Paceibacterota bacterium]HMO82862.1 dUTP diphosphatase [Candidatus Paceibacterota bacterium]